MALVALLSLSLVLFSFSTKNTTLTLAQCLPEQRHALIKLKHGFNTTQLHSWNASTDCCKWDGITCDVQTGMVIALNLTDRSISGELNLALFNLSSLRYLNLADNNFINIPLPQTGFEQLGNLTHLDLSYSGFTGQVPIGISALTNLISLDLSDISSSRDSTPYPINNMYLHDNGLKTLLSNLTKLQVLWLDGVDISLNGSQWGKAVFKVGPTVKELSMVDCRLRGNFPDEIFHLTNLTRLDLSSNPMLGQLPEFPKQSFLQHLLLAFTNFTGQLPDSIGNLQHLLELDFYNCNFYGEIPPSITNLTRLEYLTLSSNKLTGTIPMNLFSHPSLEILYLSRNQLSGYLPDFSNGSSILKEIILNFNNLQGPLSISIFNSPQLQILYLASNKFNGTLNLDIIKNIKKLEYLNLSNNKLSIIEGKNHNESFYASFPQLKYLVLTSCNLTKFPSFLSSQTNITLLDLSNNKIIDVVVLTLSKMLYLFLSNNSFTGNIPISICNATFLQMLDLSYNNFIGTVPTCLLEIGELEMLNLRSNKLSGPLSQNISRGCNLITIDLSGNGINGSLPQSLLNCNALEVLDLGNNQIVNRFPFWLGNLKNLRVLVLRSNQFYGTITNMEGNSKTNNSFFSKLKVFDLSSNRFEGIIPKFFFQNLKAMVTNLDTVTFQFSWDANYYQNSITVISKGQEMEIKGSLSIFSSLDLSQNGFLGEIPKEIGQLKSLHVLNLSHNALTGSIPLEFGNLDQLESLDLSSNLLSGPIPQELTALTFLSVLNLSYNYLVGEIPEAHQFSTYLNDSYLGNPGLCGSPLSMQCTTTLSDDGFNKGLPSKSSTYIIGLSVSIGLGLSVGFASVIWSLVSWDNGRDGFNLVVDWFYFRYL